MTRSSSSSASAAMKINISSSALKLDVNNRIALGFYYRIADNVLKQVNYAPMSMIMPVTGQLETITTYNPIYLFFGELCINLHISGILRRTCLHFSCRLAYLGAKLWLARVFRTSQRRVDVSAILTCRLNVEILLKLNCLRCSEFEKLKWLGCLIYSSKVLALMHKHLIL